MSCKMLTFGRLREEYTKSLYHFCNISISLKLDQNEKLIKNISLLFKAKIMTMWAFTGGAAVIVVGQ